MSEMETRKGRLVLVPNTSGCVYETAMEILKELCPDRYMEYVDDFNGDTFDALLECCYDDQEGDQYMVIGKNIYKVLEDAELDNNYFCEITNNPDGTISYLASWYNGGGSLSEVLENELKRLTNPEPVVN